MPLGAHVSTAGGLSTAVGRAQAIGAECIQVFLCAPQQWKEPNHAVEEIQRFTDLACGAGIGPNFAHAIYLINLASADETIRARSVQALRACADWGGRCGLEGVVVHIGSAKGQSLEDAENGLVRALAEVFDSDGGARVLLENSAGSGETLGSRLEQVGWILREGADERLGVCLDTAHAFASGYDLRTPDGVAELLDDFDRHIGLDRLGLVHANDSKAPLGSARDRHENIGQGELGEHAFELLLAEPALTKVPWVLEVPGYAKEGPDRENVDALKRLAGRG